MNIGIDARLLNEKITGINRVLWNLVKYIPQFDKANNYFLYLYEDSPFKNNFYTYIKFKRSQLPRQLYEHYWLNFILPKYLAKNKIDLFFTPYFLVPINKGKYKNVIVIHDVMTKACGEFFTAYYKKYMDIVVPQAIKRSDIIVTISESAKNDIIRYYNVAPEKIHIMYLWTDEKYKPINISEEQKELLIKKYDLPEIFILFVGAIEERKNIRGILKISDILFSKGIDIKIILAGKKGFGFKQIHEEIKKRSERVIYLDYIDENDLPFIYNLSKMFLFPSHYEGFGLPPLEAMKCGIPVLSANNSSLPEVVDKGGFLIDADDYESFALNIISLIHDDNFYNSIRTKALERAKIFSPELQIPKLINAFNTVNNY